MARWLRAIDDVLKIKVWHLMMGRITNSDFVDWVDKQPTIEAEPVKPGELLTLEDLKQMAGQPVWVEVIDHKMFADKEDDFDGWGLVRSSWVRLWDESRADIVHVDYDFEEYGKTWRAYSTPVKHGKWEEFVCDYGGIPGIGYYCSECGHAEMMKYLYCNCGARMDGK